MKKNRDEFISGMKSQLFGVEVELTGITRSDCEYLLAEYFGDREEYFAEMFKLYFSGVVKEMDAPYFCQYIEQQTGS